MCNGEKPESVLISVTHRDAPIPDRSETYAFSGLLKFSAEDEEQTVETDTCCDDGFVYDSIQVMKIKYDDQNNTKLPKCFSTLKGGNKN